MRKTLICAALATVALGGAAAAHPFNLRFQTRGECERVMADVNNFDRVNVAQFFGIEDIGEAEVFFLESFQCEYDAAEGMWRIANHLFDDSANGRAFDD